MFCTIEFFTNREKGICADDFTQPIKAIIINTDSILSLSEVFTFKMPLSGTNTVHKYAELKMKNNDIYYITQYYRTRLIETIKLVKL